MNRGSPGRRPGTSRGERGMVTVELAVGVVTAVVVTACLVGLALLGVAQSACAEASAQIARQEARGDAELVSHARERVPDGADVRVERGADGVAVTVSVRVGVPGVGQVPVTASAWAAYEPGEGP